MTSVAVIGLGAMGAALAGAQIDAGHATTVWNRSPEKAAPLVERGARLARTAAKAAQAGDVTLICVATYADAEIALNGVWQPGALAGRTVVQLGTASPDEARRFAERVEAAGGQALDGALMFYPDEVGPTSKSPLIVGGSTAGFDAAEPCLRPLSGNLQYLGANVAAAAALDLSLLTVSIALFAGVAHAARICESEGASLATLGKLASHGERPRELFEIIGQDAFALNSLYGGATLGVWADVIDRIEGQARDAGINAEVPGFLGGLYRRAVAAGYGDEDVAALVKLLRDG